MKKLTVSLSAWPEEKRKRKRLFFEDFISKRKKAQKRERFRKKLYEYIVPKKCDLLSHCTS
jgi:hypothetical protein